jgi:hypothetical protein
MWLVRRSMPVSWLAIFHGVRPTRPRSPIPARIAWVARYHGSHSFPLAFSFHLHLNVLQQFDDYLFFHGLLDPVTF